MLGRIVRSLTVRVIAVYLALLILTFGVILGVGWWLGVHRPLGVAQQRVEEDVAAARGAAARGSEDALLAFLRARERALSDRKPFHALVGPTGRMISANLPSWPAQHRGGWQRFEADLYRDGDEDDHEALSLDILLLDGRRLILGRDIEDIDDREELIGQILKWGGLAVVLIGFGGGWLVTFIVGRRLNRVAETARTVMGGDLSGRIRLSGSGDDFDRLAETLNAMLERIEQLVGSVSRVSDSIAHELRTPLARLQGDIEELGRAVGEADRQRLVELAQADADRLQQTFDSLLRIARLEAGRHQLSTEEVPLEKLLADAVELYEPEAASRRQTLSLAAVPGLAVRADRNLLFQAVANLIDNAVKFTPAGGSIGVSGAVDAGNVVIGVSDNGPGVGQADVQRLTERFYRAESAADVTGLGLGLALVDAVARASGGKVSFESDAGGFKARLVLPAAKGPGPAAMRA